MKEGKVVKKLIPMLNGEPYAKIFNVGSMITQKKALKFLFFGMYSTQ